MIGTSVGLYRITAKLGAGRIGEVYRARDTKLDRDIAIKILPTLREHQPHARWEMQRERIQSLVRIHQGF